MTNKLFSQFTIKNLTLKNRIVMAPMCMYSANEAGLVNNWHIVHYTSRAVGQVGLIMQEATAISQEGRITEADLGIWNDDQLEGLQSLVNSVKEQGTKIGIQLAHAGRKATVISNILAPSPLPFSDSYKTPDELTLEQIKELVTKFKNGAARAKKVGYDVVEIHAAHGYLINEFLSPVTNKRTDDYGGSFENRYRFLQEIIEAVKEVWDGPLFVRISADEYEENGLNIDDHLKICKLIKEQNVDLIDVSSGGLTPKPVKSYPGYQVPYAEKIKDEVNIPTGTVGLISSGLQAEEILQNNRADLIFIGRELLRDPYWPKRAAKDLKTKIDCPKQYERGWN